MAGLEVRVAVFENETQVICSADFITEYENQRRLEGRLIDGILYFSVVRLVRLHHQYHMLMGVTCVRSVKVFLAPLAAPHPVLGRLHIVMLSSQS